MPVADRVAQSQYPRAIATTTALLINSHTARCGWCYAYGGSIGILSIASLLSLIAYRRYRK
ncbi:GlyGly-CTERM sorting domain-containing protein [Acinetobacter baumannii]|uniref:GlyGly-CTERM sorting domain-containing protein n=1 Tax=Acinetobacter baumannii TaxID=470 RepID=UPI0036F46885